jgi:hypothetical protein
MTLNHLRASLGTLMFPLEVQRIQLWGDGAVRLDAPIINYSKDRNQREL